MENEAEIKENTYFYIFFTTHFSFYRDLFNNIMQNVKLFFSCNYYLGNTIFESQVLFC